MSLKTPGSKTPGSARSRRVHRTSSAGINVRALPSLGRLGRPLKTEDVALFPVGDGKRSLLTRGGNDCPVASLFLPPQLKYDRLVQKLISSGEVSDSRHNNVQYRIAERNDFGSQSQSGSSLSFNMSPSTTKRTSLRQGKLKLSHGRLHVSGVAKEVRGVINNTLNMFTKSNKDSSSTVGERDRKVSVASVQMSDMDEVLFNTFYLAQLFQIKFSTSSCTKLSLLFYSGRNNEENFKNKSWKTLPEFDEVILKFESSEATREFINDILLHTEYASEYLGALVDQVIENVDNDRVDESSEKGQQQIICAVGRMRLSLDLKALVYGYRSSVVVDSMNLLANTLQRHGDQAEEASFWRESAARLSAAGEPEADARKDLLAIAQREMRDKKKTVEDV